MSILSFSVRDRHPQDQKIIKWWNGFDGSYERSRKMREILLSHIDSKEHIMISDESNQQSTVKAKVKPVELTMVNMSGGGEEEDLDIKLEGFGEML